MPKDTRPKRGPKPDTRESSDTYHRELWREGNWRICVCHDGIQWLLQHRTRADNPAGPRWVSKSFCQTQQALARLWPGTEPAGRAFIASLPPHIARWVPPAEWQT